MKEFHLRANLEGCPPHLLCMEVAGELDEVKVHERATNDFEIFFEATWPRLFRTTYAVAGDAASAEEALQSAFTKAYASWRKVRSVDHPEAYVRRMAINEVLGVRRRAWWKSEITTAELPLTDSVPSAEASIVDREVMWQSICALPIRQRAVIVLRYYEDLSEQQIADALGCSTGTVKSQASAALAALRVRSAPTVESQQVGDPS